MTENRRNKIFSILKRAALSFQSCTRALRAQFGLTFIFLTLLIAAGGYYFWKTDSSQKAILSAIKAGGDSAPVSSLNSGNSKAKCPEKSTATVSQVIAPDNSFNRGNSKAKYLEKSTTTVNQIIVLPDDLLDRRDLEVKYLEESTTTVNQIVVVPIEGKISEDAGMVEYVKDALRLAAEDQNVKAIILFVQSPGGTVNASDLIWNELVKFKKSKKPVVAFFNGLAASGGYYVSTPADKIIATPETITGSIGVIMQSPDYSKLMRKMGIKQNVIKSGRQKDILSPYRPLNREARKILQKMVNSAYSRFVKKVAEGRKMSEKSVRAIADGRIYDAEEALSNGLIDEIGYIEDAFVLAESLAKIENASLVQYVKSEDASEDISEKADFNPLASVSKSLIQEKPGLYYLWYSWTE